MVGNHTRRVDGVFDGAFAFMRGESANAWASVGTPLAGSGMMVTSACSTLECEKTSCRFGLSERTSERISRASARARNPFTESTTLPLGSRTRTDAISDRLARQVLDGANLQAALKHTVQQRLDVLGDHAPRGRQIDVQEMAPSPAAKTKTAARPSAFSVETGAVTQCTQGAPPTLHQNASPIAMYSETGSTPKNGSPGEPSSSSSSCLSEMLEVRGAEADIDPQGSHRREVAQAETRGDMRHVDAQGAGVRRQVARVDEHHALP